VNLVTLARSEPASADTDTRISHLALAVGKMNR
jgi:hypothetical protein